MLLVCMLLVAVFLITVYLASMPFFATPLKKLSMPGLFVLLLSGLAAPAISDTFSLKVDKTIVEEGQSVELSFSFDGDTDGDRPDFTVLRDNFDIITSYPSTQRYNVNGRVSIVNQWVFQVIPKRKGTFIIPPISFKGESTEATSIEVRSTGALGTSQDIFLETIVDKSSAYIGEQIKLTYRLYFDTNIDNQLEIDELNINDVELIKAPVQQYERRVDGRLYQVAEFVYLVRAERDGTVVIPQLNWNIRVNNNRARSLFDSFGRYEIVRQRSQEKIIRIKEIPPSYPKDTAWLPAKSLQVEQSWSGDTNRMEVGAPLTRKITVKAKGLPAKSLPVLKEETDNNEIRVYAEPPAFEDTFDGGDIIGSYAQSSAVIVNEAGSTALPELRLAWWNTEKDQLEYSVIPAQNLMSLKSNSTTPSVKREQSSDGMTTKTSLADNNMLAVKPEPGATESNRTSALIWILTFTNLVTLIVLAVALAKNAKRNAIKETNARSERDQTNTILKQIRRRQSEQDITAIYSLVNIFAKQFLSISSYAALTNLAEFHSHNKLQLALQMLESQLFSQHAKMSDFPCDFASELKSLHRLREKPLQSDSLPVVYTY